MGSGREGRKAANLAALKLRAKLAKGDTGVFIPPAPAATVPTVRQYSERWLTETIAPHRKPRTEQYYRSVLERHVWPALGGMSLTELKPPHIRALIAEKAASGAARNTVKNIAATLRAMLYQAQQVDELINANPAARFGKFFDARHDAREHVVVLEPPDVRLVLKTAAKWYPDHELMIQTLFYTGVREGELLGLQWPDIDWPRNLIDLRRTVDVRKGQLIVNTPKSGKLRTVDVPADLCRRLRDLYSIRQAETAVAGIRLSPWVWPSATDPERPLNASWFWRHVWQPLLEKASVRHIRVHDARHTYASLLLRRGVPIAYVSKQLGHSSIKVTVDLYGHFIPGADRHHIEALADAIEAAEEGQNATPAQPVPVEADHAARN